VEREHVHRSPEELARWEARGTEACDATRQPGEGCGCGQDVLVEDAPAQGLPGVAQDPTGRS